MLPFQIRSGPQFRHFSSKMLRFQIRSGPQFRHFSVDFTGPLEGGRVVSGRVGSGRRFAFSYSFSTTRPRFARAIITNLKFAFLILRVGTDRTNRTNRIYLRFSIFDLKVGTLPRAFTLYLGMDDSVQSANREILRCYGRKRTVLMRLGLRCGVQKRMVDLGSRVEVTRCFPKPRKLCFQAKMLTKCCQNMLLFKHINHTIQHKVLYVL